MSRYQDAFDAHQRTRFMRPDAHRWIRPDAARFLAPGMDPASVYPALASAETKYSPNQPRVPAGNGRESGRWTDGGGGQSYDARLASSDKPPRIGPAAMHAIMMRAAKRLIEAYRSENGLRDLFGRNEGTVAVSTIDGKDIFGSNSTSPTYTATDRRVAERLRDDLIEKYPTILRFDNVGYKPNDALFHAETTTLLRAAKASGGTLAGRSLEIFVDRPMCRGCDKVLPYVGRELGNPTVTFVGPGESRKVMSNGVWIE
jgi:hypothetical protein